MSARDRIRTGGPLWDSVLSAAPLAELGYPRPSVVGPTGDVCRVGLIMLRCLDRLPRPAITASWAYAAAHGPLPVGASNTTASIDTPTPPGVRSARADSY